MYVCVYRDRYGEKKIGRERERGERGRESMREIVCVCM